jgi:hypothetical protein
MGRRRSFDYKLQIAEGWTSFAPEASSSVDCLFGVYWGHLLDYESVESFFLFWDFPLCNR